MQIIINLSEEEYTKLQDGRISVNTMRKAILDGTVLPAQARIIDMDKLAITPIDITDLPHDRCLMVYYPEDLDDATILERSDKE